MFISYNQRLKKSFTFDIIPDTCLKETMFLIERFYVKVTYDIESFDNIILDELKRYGSEFVDITEVYPYNTQYEKDYYNAVFPNKITRLGNHNKMEMERYRTIVKEIVYHKCSKDTFSKLISFILDQLLFMHLTGPDRDLIFDMGNTVLTEIPSGMTSNIYYFLDALKSIFNVYTGNYFDFVYKIRNNRQLSEFADMSFPILINAPTFRNNVIFIIDNTPVDYNFVDVSVPPPDHIQNEYRYTEVNTSCTIDNFVDNIAITNITSDIYLTLKEINVIGLKRYTINDKLGNAESYNITILPSSSDTILNTSQFVISDDYTSITLCSDGVSNWYIM
jgi:hypothetical protein